MKALLLTAALMFSAQAFAGDGPAPVCSKNVNKAASALFKINVPGSKATQSAWLVESASGEGELEIWEVNFLNSKGESVVAPYRFGVIPDGCMIIHFSMPTAG